MENKPAIYTSLHTAKELLYAPCGLHLTSMHVHAEGRVYGACSFLLNGKLVEYRVAKTTPKKVGQFVTTWKRNKHGITEPFDVSDPVDFLIITSMKEEQMGQFVFPKPVLADQGVISQNGKGGKRGIRVYPPWDTATSEQAKKTQRWQTRYFVTITPNGLTDLDLLKGVLHG